MEDILDVMYARQSVREFADEAVSDEQIEAMLRAAMAAPSVQDFQPWHFVTVRQRKMLDRLAQVHKYATILEDAPLAVVVCGDTEISERYWVEDTCVATQNVLLAATALGMGGVWISLYPKKKHQRYVRDLLDIPERIGVLCILALGRPAEKKIAKAKYNPKRVHQEEW
jgi:nitroreductase